VIELQQVLYVMVLACFAYLSVIFLVDVVLLAVSAIENGRRIRQRRGESLNAVFSSEYVMPVSVVVPVHNEETVIVAVVRSLLRLEYPQHEVVVVNDGSSDGTLALLQREFALERRATFARQRYSRGTDPVTYRSRTDPRLVVVDGRVNRGSKALALNLGLDFCRYPYVCCVDGDTIYEPRALLSSMRLVLRDPAHVVGLTSQIVVATHPELPYRHTPGLAASTLLHNFQHLEYLRSFLSARLAWSRLNSIVCTSGAFMLYRRDVLEAVGGYSPDFSCEDIELTFRVHEHFLRRGVPYRILAMPEPVARTEGPDRIRTLTSQRARWQRVMLETAWHYRHMAFNPRYGRFGMISFPFMILSEVLAPFIELIALATLAAAAIVGAVHWADYGLAVVLMSLAIASVTVLAVRLEDAGTRSYRFVDLVWLTVLSPLELVVYRPILFWAHLRGAFGFFRGDTHWERFDRNLREAPSRLELL